MGIGSIMSAAVELAVENSDFYPPPLLLFYMKLSPRITLSSWGLKEIAETVLRVVKLI
jgi:hypothetical protein